MLSVSLTHLSVTLCFVAKRYILQQKCLKQVNRKCPARNMTAQLSTSYATLSNSPHLKYPLQYEEEYKHYLAYIMLSRCICRSRDIVYKLFFSLRNFQCLQCDQLSRASCILKVNQGQSLVPFLGCLPSRSSSDSTHMMHAWDLFLKYYEVKVRFSLFYLYPSSVQFDGCSRVCFCYSSIINTPAELIRPF